MYERCLNEAERILATSKEIVLPVKQVWKLLADEGKRRLFDVPALTDFDALLEGDRRFEIISSQSEPDELPSLLSEPDEDNDSSLGTLGFFPEDRVKLRRLKLPVQSRTEGALKEEDEDMVPLNVRGLSTTRPVGRVETRKTTPDKKSSKKPGSVKSSPKSLRKKLAKSKASSKSKGRRPSRKSRS
jgi:hypothetical protein